MKRLSLLLLIKMLIVLTVNAQRFSYQYQGIKFKCKVNSDMVTITGFDRKADKVVIPNKVNYNGKSYRVDKIDTYISGYNYSTVSLIIEEGITEIENYSFIEFRKLEHVVLPNSLTDIGRNSFANVNDITYFEAPQSICLIVNRSVVNDLNSVWAQSTPSQPVVSEPTPTVEPMPQPERIVVENENMPTNQEDEPTIMEMLSDVDVNIPDLGQMNNNSFAVIIANEMYDVESKVDFAIRDGRIFKEYCQKILGLPEENIRLIENATHMQIKRNIEWLKKIAQISRGECRLLVYYAGHGMPDEEQNCAYILPTDAYASDIEVTGYSLKEMYEQLGAMPAQSVTVFLDACFSGMQRNGEPIVASRGIARKPNKESLTGKLVVFSATSDSESAYSYKSQGHGLFTYYLLKKLKETKGNVSYGELYSYLRKEVGLKSLTLNDKGQTPEVYAAPQLKMHWRTFKFNINH